MSDKKAVLVAPSTYGSFDRRGMDLIERHGITVIRNSSGRKMTQEELVNVLGDVDGIISGLETLSREVLARSRLKVISRCGVGMSNVDLVAAKEMGIKVFNTPLAPVTAVAEVALGAMIVMMRRVHIMDGKMHGGTWEKQVGPELQGKTVVIIGFGRIGRKLAEFLKPFKVTLYAVDPLLKDAVDGIQILPLRDALPRADIVSLHASGGDRIMGKDEFALLKRGSFLMNAGRGGLIDEEALCRALDSGVIAGAWIDAFTEEPYQGPLIRYPQALLTPHIGYSSVEGRRQMEYEAAENVLIGLGLRKR